MAPHRVAAIMLRLGFLLAALTLLALPLAAANPGPPMPDARECAQEQIERYAGDTDMGACVEGARVDPIDCLCRIGAPGSCG